MKISPEQAQQEDADYAAAFGEDQPMPPDSEEAVPEEGSAEAPAVEQAAEAAPADMPEMPAQEASETPAAEAAESPVEQQAEMDAGAEMPMEPEAAASDAPAPEASPALDIEKERQRLKSWEGRLKAQQAALDAREAQGKGDDEPGEQAAEALEKVAEMSDNPELTHEALQAAEQVESGKMTYEQAAAMLSEDFGGDFVSLIKVIAQHEGGNASGGKVAELQAALQQMSQAFGQLVTELNDRDVQAHTKAISRAHKDVEEIAGSDGFRAYILAMPEDERVGAERVINEGEADEIIELLSAYKKSQEQTDADSGPDDAALDAAEGVRSTGGIKLPEQPKMGGSYEEAWNEY